MRAFGLAVEAFCVMRSFSYHLRALEWSKSENGEMEDTYVLQRSKALSEKVGRAYGDIEWLRGWIEMRKSSVSFFPGWYTLSWSL